MPVSGLGQMQLQEMVRLVRLEAGHSSRSSHGQNTREHIIAALQRKQRELYEAHSWRVLSVERSLTFQGGDRTLNFPSDINPIRQCSVWHVYGDEYVRLAKGIGPAQYQQFDSRIDERSYPPERWDYDADLGQIELWPVPSDSGELLVNGTRALGELTDDEHYSTLNGDMLVLYVAAEVLARHQAADADQKFAAAEGLRRSLLTNEGNAFSRPARYGLGGRRRHPRRGIDYMPSSG